MRCHDANVPMGDELNGSGNWEAVLKYVQLKAASLILILRKKFWGISRPMLLKVKWL